MNPGTPPRTDLDVMIERWVASDIITVDQAERMRADTIEPPGALTTRPAVPGTSLVTEAMGYLGGVIILVALGLVAGQLWSHLSTWARLGLVAAVTVVLLVAGGAIPQRLGAPGARLRAVLWLAASGGVATFLGLTAGDGFGWTDETATLFAACGTAVVSMVLWLLHRHVLQHLAVLVALLVGGATAASLLPAAGALAGLALWGIGVTWSALAWGGIVTPRGAGIVAGAVATVIGAVSVAGEDWGSSFALLTVTGLVLVSVAFRDLALLAVASLGTLIVLPMVVARFLPGILSAALVLLAVGGLLLAAAVFTARRRRAVAVSRRDWGTGTPRAALIIAGVIAATTTAVILAAGLTD